MRRAECQVQVPGATLVRTGAPSSGKRRACLYPASIARLRAARLASAATACGKNYRAQRGEPKSAIEKREHRWARRQGGRPFQRRDSARPRDRWQAPLRSVSPAPNPRQPRVSPHTPSSSARWSRVTMSDARQRNPAVSNTARRPATSASNSSIIERVCGKNGTYGYDAICSRVPVLTMSVPS